MERVGEFSSCSVLKSKYDILKLRLEIIEKFGHYVPEIDQKLKDIEYKVEMLYQALKYHQGPSENQNVTNVSKGITTTTPAAIEEPFKASTEENLRETNVSSVDTKPDDRLYITDIMDTGVFKLTKQF